MSTMRAPAIALILTALGPPGTRVQTQQRAGTVQTDKVQPATAARTCTA